MESRGKDVGSSLEDRSPARTSLARSIAVGGIGIVAFAATLALAWYSAATLFMLFAGILFGVFLTAMADLLRRVFGGSQTLRLVIVCILFTGLLSSVAVLGGATIAQQVTALSSTIRAQLGNAKDFLEKQGVDTSFLNLGTTKAAATDATAPKETPASPSRGPKLPDA
ncbi:MAG: AI-2E family transporter, partial [Rhizobiales bacterium]|nr:AI-2E family transporter [Hyphomicrobiales bacterium]